MSDDLIDRLNDAVDSLGNFPDHRDIKPNGMTERAGIFLDGISDLLREAAATIAEARETNRKLHRRVQLSEAANQSTEGILAGWKEALKDRYSHQNQKWLLFSFALDDIVKQREKIAAALSAPTNTGEKP